jgi:hypothetical protein
VKRWLHPKVVAQELGLPQDFDLPADYRLALVLLGNTISLPHSLYAVATAYSVVHGGLLGRQRLALDSSRLVYSRHLTKLQLWQEIVSRTRVQNQVPAQVSPGCVCPISFERLVQGYHITSVHQLLRGNINEDAVEAWLRLLRPKAVDTGPHLHIVDPAVASNSVIVI